MAKERRESTTSSSMTARDSVRHMDDAKSISGPERPMSPFDPPNQEVIEDIKPSSSRSADEANHVDLEKPVQVSDLVELDGPDDPYNPQGWSYRTKLAQTMILAFTTLVVTFASSVFSNATNVVAEEFGVPPVVGVLGTSLFVLGYVVGPLIWGPMSEYNGRRFPLLVSYFGFGVFQIPVAVAQNIQTIMICRFFGGVFACGPLAIVGGALADFWEPEKRGGATAIFALATFGGPALGPIIGGFVTQSYLGWRWTAYITAIWAFSQLTVCFFFLKESYLPVLLQQKAKRIRMQTKNWAIHSKLDEQEVDVRRIFTVFFSRPLKMLVTEPMLLLVSIYISFVYGVLYLLFGAVPIEFEVNRGWGMGVGALPFAGVFVGCVIGCFIIWSFSPRYTAKLHAAQANNKTGRPIFAVPEERLIPMSIGAVVLVFGLFGFAWTSSQHVSSWVPSVIFLVLVGTGVLLIFLQAINYIIDAYLMFANSAIAANTFMRSFFGAGFPLFTTAMYDKLGVDWASTLLGFIALAMVPIPIAFYFYGERIRRYSHFAPT